MDRPGDATERSADRELIAEIDDGIDADAIADEEAAASRRLAAIEAGRRKGGIAGAAMAGAMLSLQEIYQGPIKDDTPVAEVEAPGEPGDIDEDGIDVTVGDVDVWAPPPRRADDEA